MTSTRSARRSRCAPTNFAWPPRATLAASYGLDNYVDVVSSKAWTIFRDTDNVFERPRGQYISGSQYFTGGLWGQLRFEFWERVALRAGGRLALAGVRVEEEEESATAGINRRWSNFVGDAGLSVRATPWLRFVAGVNQGFRAPNLDDLTSRQQTGPGFQRENPDLEPERSTAVEGGFTIEHERVSLSGHVFQTWNR